MESHAAVLEITHEQLKAALGVPEEVNLVAIAQDANDILSRSIRLLLEHDALPQRAEGAFPKTLTVAEILELLSG